MNFFTIRETHQSPTKPAKSTEIKAKKCNCESEKLDCADKEKIIHFRATRTRAQLTVAHIVL